MTERCGRETRDGSPCQNVAGKGTGHLGEGPCKYHGGASPACEDAINERLLEAGRLGSKALVQVLRWMVEKIEEGDVEDVNVRELDRLTRTALDRVGYGPMEGREHTGMGGEEMPVKVFDVRGDDGWPEPGEDVGDSVANRAGGS